MSYFPIKKLPLIRNARPRVGEDTLSIEFAIDELSVVSAAVLERVYSDPVTLSVLELSLVSVPIIEIEYSIAMFYSLFTVYLQHLARVSTIFVGFLNPVLSLTLR